MSKPEITKGFKSYVLILIILEVLYENYDIEQVGKTWGYVLILIILEVLYESYHYNHVIFNRKQQKA